MNNEVEIRLFLTYFLFFCDTMAGINLLCRDKYGRVSTKGDTLQQAMEIGNKINSTDRFIFSESVFVGHNPPKRQ